MTFLPGGIITMCHMVGYPLPRTSGLGTLGTYPSRWQQHLVVTTETEACTVSKWAVCILVECCLILHILHLYLKQTQQHCRHEASRRTMTVTVIEPSSLCGRGSGRDSPQLHNLSTSSLKVWNT